MVDSRRWIAVTPAQNVSAQWMDSEAEDLNPYNPWSNSSDTDAALR
jgi:hypothetical protein